MAVFLVRDGMGRSLCLLTAADLAAAQSFVGRFLPAADVGSVSGSGLSTDEQTAELQWCRMPPVVAP